MSSSGFTRPYRHGGRKTHTPRSARRCRWCGWTIHPRQERPYCNFHCYDWARETGMSSRSAEEREERQREAALDVRDDQ